MRVGQSVTDGVGLVGRVLHADPSPAVVLLAADPGSGVGARDTRTGEIGVATGAGRGRVRVPRRSTRPRQVGDQLVTGPAGASSYVAGPVRRAGDAVRELRRRHAWRGGRPDSRRRPRSTVVGVVARPAERSGRRSPRGAAMNRARLAAARRLLTALVLQATLVGPAHRRRPGQPARAARRGDRLRGRAGAGMAFGFAAGLIADLGSAHPAGVLALCWLGVGLVCG